MEKPTTIRESEAQKHCVQRPSNVPLIGDRTGLSTFGALERERAAGRLIRFFQSKGMWCAFTLEELGAFYRSKGWSDKGMLYGLRGTYHHFGDDVEIYEYGDTLVSVADDGTFAVTDRFIEHCMSGVASTA